MPCYYLYKNKWHSEESITNILKDGELRELIEKNILFPKTPITAPKTVPEKTQKEEPKKDLTKKAGDLQVNDVVLYDGEPYRIYKINSKNSFDLSNGQGGWVLDASPKDKEWGGATDIKLSVPQREPMPVDRETYNSLLEQLDESIKGVLGGVLRGKEFASKLKEQSGREIRDTKGTVYGFVGKDGKVYLNGDKINANTPIHEYGHVWINAIKKIRPDIYNKGLEIADKTKYVAELLKNPAYKDAAIAYRKGNKTALLEEALAMAIGDRGEMIVNSANKKRFKEWLKDFWNSVKEFFGGKLTDLTPEQVQNLKPLEFIELAAGQLVGGERVFEGGTTADAQLQSKESYIQVGDKNISLTKLKEYGDQVNTGRSLLKRLSPDYEQGRNRGGQALIEATILTRAVQEAVRKPKKGGADNLFTKREEATALEQYARQEGIWVDNTDKKYPQYDDNGQEQKVYFNPDDNTVTKVNSGAYSKNTWLDLFDRIAVHNTVFPMSAYEVVGFGRDKDGAFQVILKQPFIRGSATTVDKVAEHMTKMGFEPIPGKKLGKEEYRGKNGIIIYDLHGGNVLVTEEGNIVVFDPLIDFSEYNLGEIDLSPLDETQLQSINGTDAERAQIEAQAKKDGTWMKAPNGKPTNLSEQQWVTVRTKAFKDWFGDFENDNSLKFVDENGEPAVFYHGSKNFGFTEFREDKLGSNTRAGSATQGFFFSKSKATASSKSYVTLKTKIDEMSNPFYWAESASVEAAKIMQSLGISDDKIKKAFGSNIIGYKGVINDEYSPVENQDYENADSIDDTISFLKQIYNDIENELDPVAEEILNKDPKFKEISDTYITTATEEERRLYAKESVKVVESLLDEHFSGIKNAIDILENYEAELVPDEDKGSGIYEVFLRSESAKEYDQNGEKYRERSYYEIVRDAKKKNNDGVLIKNTYDGAGLDDIAIVFSPNQIKLADGTNTTFDPNTNDIRFQIIGEHGAQNTLKQQRLEERKSSAAARVERARLGLIEAYGEWIAPGAINDPLKNWDSTRKLIGRLLEYAIARGIKTKEDLIALVKKEISAAGGGYKAIEDYIVKAVLRGIRAYDKSDKDDLQLTELLADIRGDIETAPSTLYKLFDEAESSERKGKILKFINVMLTERQEQLEGLEVPEATGLADVEAKLTEALDLHIDPDTVFGRRDQTNWATFDTDQRNEAALKPNTVRSIQHALAFLSGWHNEYIKHSNGNSTQFVRFVANWLQTPAGQNAVSAGSLRAGLMQLVKDLKRDKKPNTPNAVYSNMEKIVKQLSGGADWASSMGAAFRSLQRNIFDRLNTEQFGNMVDKARSLVDAINTTPISEEAADPDNHRVIKARHNASKGSAEARRVVSPKPSHRKRAKSIISNTNRQNMEDRVKRIKEAIKKCK